MIDFYGGQGRNRTLIFRFGSCCVTTTLLTRILIILHFGALAGNRTQSVCFAGSPSSQSGTSANMVGTEGFGPPFSHVRSVVFYPVKLRAHFNFKVVITLSCLNSVTISAKYVALINFIF